RPPACHQPSQKTRYRLAARVILVEDLAEEDPQRHCRRVQAVAPGQRFGLQRFRDALFGQQGGERQTACLTQLLVLASALACITALVTMASLPEGEECASRAGKRGRVRNACG